jgi:hypothetical protein
VYLDRWSAVWQRKSSPAAVLEKERARLPQLAPPELGAPQPGPTAKAAKSPARTAAYAPRTLALLQRRPHSTSFQLKA